MACWVVAARSSVDELLGSGTGIQASAKCAKSAQLKLINFD